MPDWIRKNIGEIAEDWSFFRMHNEREVKHLAQYAVRI